MKLALRLMVFIVVFALGAGVVLFIQSRNREAIPDPPALVLRIREVMRLQSLDVSVYKKVSFEPQPESAETIWGDLFNFVKHTVAAPKGKAIIFADLHLAFDLSRLSVDRIRISGTRIEVDLPPPTITVELKPGETEIIGSNLDSAETAKLFELAKDAFEHEAAADEPLKNRAKLSAETSLRALLLSIGFREVLFVEHVQAPAAL